MYSITGASLFSDIALHIIGFVIFLTYMTLNLIELDLSSIQIRFS